MDMLGCFQSFATTNSTALSILYVHNFTCKRVDSQGAVAGSKGVGIYNFGSAKLSFRLALSVYSSIINTRGFLFLTASPTDP